MRWREAASKGDRAGGGRGAGAERHSFHCQQLSSSGIPPGSPRIGWHSMWFTILSIVISVLELVRAVARLLITAGHSGL
jgi:hypothetical protein